VTAVDENLPQSFWDATAKRIMCDCPVIPAYNQHSIGQLVRQVTSA